jgi:flagellar basal body-associated protein FliL
MKIEYIFQILAVVLAGAAAYFFWFGNKDGAFISVVLGCVAFFLSVRFQVKARNQVREAEREAAYENDSE